MLVRVAIKVSYLILENISSTGGEFSFVLWFPKVTSTKTEEKIHVILIMWALLLWLSDRQIAGWNLDPWNNLEDMCIPSMFTKLPAKWVTGI